MSAIQGSAAAPAQRPPIALRAAVSALAALAAFTLDRVTKELAAAQISPAAPVNVLGEWVRLAHLHNSGTAFGMFPGSAPVLAYVTLPVLALIGWMYLRGTNGSLLAMAILGLVLGAGAGNTLDRAVQGYVEDFVDVGVPGGVRFWTFNLSDLALVLGILSALVPSLRPRRATAPARHEELAREDDVPLKASAV